ncbi:MAG: type IV secretion system DNA-binding domain-containing protein [Calditrichaeota bacterium]|nr:type IV secretion system DNA-binding domain-containing protein [Calditrichota bacterium]
MPDKNSVSRGKVEIVCWIKETMDSRKKVIKHMQQFGEEVETIIYSILPHYEWCWLTEDVFYQYWEPWNFEKADFKEIRRRESLILKETMKPRPVLGKGRQSTQPEWSEEDTIYFVHNFIPQLTTLARLLRLMLLHSEPVVFQINLQPTELQEQEEAALQHEMAKCDTVEKNYAGHEAFISRHARILSDVLLNQWMRLQDAPFLMNILLASPRAIPQSLVEAIGSEITQPVGMIQEWEVPVQPLFLQMGGYDVLQPNTVEEREQFLINLQQLMFVPWGPTLAPESLKRLRYLVDALEASAAFRFPIAGNEELLGVDVRLNRTLSLPAEVAHLNDPGNKKRHLFVGVNRHLGREEQVFIAQSDRQQHVYIIGQTGTGKTTLLKTMILSDIEAGRGVAVIDPHGDLFDELLASIPDHRIDDVVVLDPNDIDYPVGINPLEYRHPDERFHFIREFKSIILKLMRDEYGPAGLEMLGPIFFQHVQMNLLLVMSNPENPGTLIDLNQIFTVPNYYVRFIPPKVSDPQLDQWIKHVLPEADYFGRPLGGELPLGDYMRSKLENFLFDPRMRFMFGQQHTTVNFRQIMDEGKILLINLAKGELTESNSRFLGMLLLSLINQAAMSRVDIPHSRRRMFYLYVDEFQAIATENFTILLSEARKFGISLVLANQFVSQIENERIIQALFGNVGTLITFRVGNEDARRYLAPQFRPYIDAQELSNLPNWHAFVKTRVQGNSVRPFLLHTVLPDRKPNIETARKIRQLSRKKYGRPRKEVESQIDLQLKYVPPRVDRDTIREMINQKQDDSSDN